jgi:hypothetical protein
MKEEYRPFILPTTEQDNPEFVAGEADYPG